MVIPSLSFAQPSVKAESDRNCCNGGDGTNCKTPLPANVNALPVGSNLSSNLNAKILNIPEEFGTPHFVTVGDRTDIWSNRSETKMTLPDAKKWCDRKGGIVPQESQSSHLLVAAGVPATFQDWMDHSDYYKPNIFSDTKKDTEIWIDGEHKYSLVEKTGSLVGGMSAKEFSKWQPKIRMYVRCTLKAR